MDKKCLFELGSTYCFWILRNRFTYEPNHYCLTYSKTYVRKKCVFRGWNSGLVILLYWMEWTRPETVVKINTVTFSPTIKSCQAWISWIVHFTFIKQPSKMRGFFSLSNFFINYNITSSSHITWILKLRIFHKILFALFWDQNRKRMPILTKKDPFVAP